MILQHHGIKGQEWGVKHGPPYPIDRMHGRTTIKKGHKFKRLSRYDESGYKDGSAYVTITKKDSERYKGFFGARLYGLGKAQMKDMDVYQVTYEAAKNMVSPSRKERIDTVLEMYKKDPEIRKELANYYRNDYHHKGAKLLPSKFYEMRFDKFAKKLENNKVKYTVYDTFVRSIGGNEIVRNKYFSELAKKGFDYVNDDLDTAGRFGKEPSIILDRKGTVKYKGQVKLDEKDIIKTWKKEGTRVSRSELDKEGRIYEYFGQKGSKK